MSPAPFQLFDALDPATEAALTESIRRFGVLVPVVRDQHGNIIDGHHRQRIADDLGVSYRVDVLTVAGEDEARHLAFTLNADRRHLTPEQRKDQVAYLATLVDKSGVGVHSPEAIAGALGVSRGTVLTDLEHVSPDKLPEKRRGLDGKVRPAKRPAPIPEPEHIDIGGWVCLTCGDTFGIPVWECPGCGYHAPEGESECGECHLFERNPNGDIVHAEVEHDEPAITKPDLGNGVSHPARYSDALMPIFAELLADATTVLDPFAGTGRIHELQPDFSTVGVELEPEWAGLHPDTIVGSALTLPFEDGSFDAICTSPTYGNRLADHHNAVDPHLRRSYTHDLGRPLHEDNSGDLQWGEEYREFHRRAWKETSRVLRSGGVLVLNIKDHTRAGARQAVSAWHVRELLDLGFGFVDCVGVDTRQLRQGTNADARWSELVWLLRKP